MRNLINLIAVVFCASNLFGQVNMGDAGFPLTNTIPCTTYSDGSTPNFFDDGAGANYSASYNDTITFCPDLTQGTKVTLTFAINAGFTFNVDGSDSIYVYDGSDVSAPLLGMHNSVTDPNGFAYTASWNNPTGCITVVFISDGTTEGTGWGANISCGNINQPFTPHVVGYVNGVGGDAINPVDTGFVDICLGDSILFIAQPLFPNSQESTGFGYSQNVDNVSYDWYITDGNTYPNNDSIWFKPTTRNGFLIDLKITDAFPQIERILCKVRVSQLPSFEATGPFPDSICLGTTTSLLGGVTAADTVGVDVPPGTFQLGGSFAGLTYLPDGSGAQYQAPITIGGFPTGSTITNSQDLNQVCITMEHSYLGDLEIALECPNGTQVSLVNSYSPGFIPGGFGGGGTFLGDADDASGNGVPGVGWEYCFSSVFATWGDMPTEFAGGNTVPTTISSGNAMNPNGVYLPEQDFSAFNGCPVNGQWTIIVQDNIGIDDGYIFEWGLFFDPSYFPGAEGYQNTIVSSAWLPDPTIISGQTDTAIVVMPDTTGYTFYTFMVVDDYGCEYDTTVGLFVMPQPIIFEDTAVCNYALQVGGTSAFSGGVWTAQSGDVIYNDSSLNNPLITTNSMSGFYTVYFTDNQCGSTDTAIINFAPSPVFNFTPDLNYCEGTNGVFLEIVDSLIYSEASWGLVDVGLDSLYSNTLFAGTYNIHIEDATGTCVNDTSLTIEERILPSIFPDTLICSYEHFVTGTSSYSGGVWTTTEPNIIFNDPTLENPHILVSDTTPGLYTVTFTDNECNYSVTSTIDFPEYPGTWFEDTSLCYGVSYHVVALNDNVHPTSYTWSNGDTGEDVVFTEEGTYVVTLENVCYTAYKSLELDYILCDIEAPNVISLAQGSQNPLWYAKTEGLKEFTVVITNRWGNLIFECSNELGNCYWDGTDRKGNFVDEGTYFYIINAKTQGEEEINKHGFIQVIK